MGMIVSDQSYMECDSHDCNNRSASHYDQRQVALVAQRQGWHINWMTGESTCAACLQRQIRAINKLMGK